MVKATRGCDTRKACSQVPTQLPLGSIPSLLLSPLNEQLTQVSFLGAPRSIPPNEEVPAHALGLKEPLRAEDIRAACLHRLQL